MKIFKLQLFKDKKVALSENLVGDEMEYLKKKI